MKSIDVITLGCSKNLVDSEFLMRQFKASGLKVAHDPENPVGDVAIINTCGFIGDAKEESIDMILQFAEAKKQGKIKKLIVMGCLSERYLDQLGSEIPEVDKFYGKFDWQKIVEDLGAKYRYDLLHDRSLTTPTHYAYLKISEGCNRMCSYCAIPIMTGKHKSKSIETLIDETKRLVDSGVKEIQVIAQDLSYYGLDLYKELKLPQLIDQLAQVQGVEWLRLHYAYPANFPFDILKVMNDHPNVCNYLDLALQHISNPMLTKMRRNITKAETYGLINRIRKEVPNIHLRTTLITGHPGETEADFLEQLDFVREMRFERLGVFPYSHEDDTYAFINYKDDVPDEIKQERADIIMEEQNIISAQLNNDKIGKEFKVIIDRVEDDFFVGRTEYDSPEVDQEVLVATNGEALKIGNFYNVKITGAEDYDLIAKYEGK
ncbi:MAG: 30S ribosomal protein S12 methylthiotransferase RimO [Breznakibacter sp.]|nr:30S ribosomal protein S12 methylthiotransferase RimO [Breznakibacter sp.]